MQPFPRRSPGPLARPDSTRCTSAVFLRWACRTTLHRVHFGPHIDRSPALLLGPPGCLERGGGSKTKSDGRVGEGRSHVGKGTWSRVGARLLYSCLESQAWAWDVKLHSVVLSDQGVCPGADEVPVSARQRGLAATGALLRSCFPSLVQRLFPASSESCLSVTF